MGVYKIVFIICWAHSIKEKEQGWLAKNQANVSEWSDMSTADCCFSEQALWKSKKKKDRGKNNDLQNIRIKLEIEPQ
jgi:hypothetical protein